MGLQSSCGTCRYALADLGGCQIHIRSACTVLTHLFPWNLCLCYRRTRNIVKIVSWHRPTCFFAGLNGNTTPTCWRPAFLSVAVRTGDGLTEASFQQPRTLKKNTESDFLLHDLAAQSQTGLCLRDVVGSERPEDPPGLWPPDWYWLARLTLWRTPRAHFTTSAQVAQESVSEWPLPDLHPIWRVLAAPLHLCIPHKRNVAVLCLIRQLCWIQRYTERCSVGRRMKTSMQRIENGYIPSTCRGRFEGFSVQEVLYLSGAAKGMKDHSSLETRWLPLKNLPTTFFLVFFKRNKSWRFSFQSLNGSFPGLGLLFSFQLFPISGRFSWHERITAPAKVTDRLSFWQFVLWYVISHAFIAGICVVKKRKKEKNNYPLNFSNGSNDPQWPRECQTSTLCRFSMYLSFFLVFSPHFYHLKCSWHS